VQLPVYIVNKLMRNKVDKSICQREKLEWLIQNKDLVRKNKMKVETAVKREFNWEKQSLINLVGGIK
jgi:hypothetical protein